MDLTAAYKEIRATFPPPYEYPSDDQNAAQIIADALDEITSIIRNRIIGELQSQELDRSLKT